MKKIASFIISVTWICSAHTQSNLLRTEKPTKELIMNALYDFNWDNDIRANKDECKRMLSWMGATYQHEAINGNGDGFICAEFQSGYHITMWTDTYENNDRYGVRFGILDARHSFFGSNETYFEIFKKRNPYYPKRIPTATNRQPTIHIVAVGISTYQQGFMFNHLEFTVSGAYSIRHLFERRNLTSPGRPICESSARRRDIISALESLTVSGKVGEDDMVIFYFSGHGLIAGGKVGICPYDYQSPTDLISDEEISAILSRSPAKHKVCLIEACKSEASADYIDPATVVEFNKQRRSISSGIVFITSTEVGKKSWGGTEGYFTKAALEALDEGKADSNDDKIVTAQEFFNYVLPAVKTKTNNQQIPQINTSYPKELPLMLLKN